MPGAAATARPGRGTGRADSKPEPGADAARVAASSVPRGAPLAYGDHGAHRGDAVQIPVLDRPNSFAQELFAPLPARYDRLAEVLSFGQNGRWRRAMVDHVVSGDQPRLVLDVAAGTAGVSLQIAERTGARVIGLDLTRAMLAQGARISERSAPTASLPL
jgi:SAM-dependent methyltransferase